MFKYYDLVNGSIIDSEFVATRPLSEGYAMDNMMADLIIDVYMPRNKNVPANLALMFQWGNKVLGWDITEAIYNSKKYCPRYAQYADAVEKYLLLI